MPHWCLQLYRSFSTSKSHIFATTPIKFIASTKQSARSIKACSAKYYSTNITMAFKPEFETTGNEVVEQFKSRVDGRTFVITGPGENGLGAETALSLASKASPKLMILVGRTKKTIEPVVEAIKKSNSSLPVHIVELDLSSQASVREGAPKIAKIIDEECDGKLDVLINNAGVMVPPYTKTKDGFELQLGTNHIGPFLLTKLLFSKIEKAAGGDVEPRIVNMSSGAYRFSGIRFDDLDFQDGKEYVRWKGYGQSKTGVILFSRELARKAASKDILVYTLNPGNIKSPLQRHMDKGVMEEMMGLIKEAMGGKTPPPTKYKSLQQGCSTTLVCALSPDIEKQSGAYLDDCQVVEDKNMAAHAVDDGARDKLWSLTEKWVGEKFEV